MKVMTGTEGILTFLIAALEYMLIAASFAFFVFALFKFLKWLKWLD